MGTKLSFVPRWRAGIGGWPVELRTWAHGTTGLHDWCARNERNTRRHPRFIEDQPDYGDVAKLHAPVVESA